MDTGAGARGASHALPRRALGLLIGLAVAGFVYHRAHPVAATIIAGVAVVLFVGALASPAFASLIDRLFAALSRAVATVLTFVLLVLQFYLVVTPLGIVRRLFGRPSIAGGFDRGEASYWTPLAPDVALPTRGYLVDTSAYRSRRALGGRVMGWVGLLALLVVIDVGGGSILRAKFLAARASWHQRHTVAHSMAAWRDSRDWMDGYLAEEAPVSTSQKYEPFVTWANRDFKGQYINIEHGLRRTWKPASAGATKLRIWVFGGSTTWGTGARDEHTIPSELARLLDADGIAAEVSNYGVQAYDAWQERLLFESLLVAGEKPDLVVFYDGINEAYAQISENGSKKPVEMMQIPVAAAFEDQGKLMPFVKLVGLGTVLNDAFLRPARKMGDIRVTGSPEKLAPLVANQYLRSVEFIARSAKAYDVPALFFWQPSYMSRQPPDPEEAQSCERAPDIAKLRSIYRNASALVAASPAVHDISNVLDDASGPLFIDLMHVNERANAIIARRMYTDVKPALPRHP